MQSTLIKHIESEFFQITMTENEKGYTVDYTVLGTDYTTSLFKHYDLAQYIFDQKLIELEGH